MPQHTELELSIIIVNWNGIDVLPTCLESIVKNPPSVPYEIVVVDNDSSDGSVGWINSSEAGRLLRGIEFRLIQSGENLGFGKANNLAISQGNAPFLFLLNPDTIVTKGAIDRLLETLKSHPGIGITAPRLFTDGVVSASVTALAASPVSILVEGLALDRILPRRITSTWLYRANWTYDERVAVPVVSGAAMMCKREMINETGSFDPSLHMYAEDYELCVRVNRHGWRIMFEPEADVVHLGGKSSAQRWTDEERILVQESARMVYENKSFSRLRNIANGLARTGVLAIHGVRHRLNGRDSGLLRKLVVLYLRNCAELLRGK